MNKVYCREMGLLLVLLFGASMGCKTTNSSDSNALSQETRSSGSLFDTFKNGSPVELVRSAGPGFACPGNVDKIQIMPNIKANYQPWIGVTCAGTKISLGRYRCQADEGNLTTYCKSSFDPYEIQFPANRTDMVLSRGSELSIFIKGQSKPIPHLSDVGDALLCADGTARIYKLGKQPDANHNQSFDFESQGISTEEFLRACICHQKYYDCKGKANSDSFICGRERDICQTGLRFVDEGSCVRIKPRTVEHMYQCLSGF